MECGKCSHEQDSGRFCTKCGTRLEEIQHTQEERQPMHEAVDIKQKAYEDSAHTNKKSNNLFVNWFINAEWKTVLLYIIPTILILSGFSWGTSFFLKSSLFIQDMAYSILVAEEILPSSQIATMIAHVSITLWDVILVSHSGSALGTIFVDGIESLSFQWKIPVIIAPIIMIVGVAIISRMMTKIHPVNQSKAVHIWLLGTILYAIIMTILLIVLAPTYETKGIELILSVSFLKVFLQTLIIGGISLWIGLRMWKYPIGSITFESTWLRGLRPVGKTLLIWFIIAIVFQMGAWMLIHPSANYAIPLLSPASLWGLYETDSMFYLLLPTYFVGELLYGLGATFHLTSAQITNAFHIYQMDLHAWLGVDIKGNTDGIQTYPHLIESATRFSWGAIISVLIYVYAITKIRLLSIKEHLLQVVLIGVIALFMAYGTTILFQTETLTEGIVGFSPLSTSLIVMLVTTIIIIGKYVFKTFIYKQKTKESGETNGDF